jgi:hypothetical protein
MKDKAQSHFVCPEAIRLLKSFNEIAANHSRVVSLLGVKISIDERQRQEIAAGLESSQRMCDQEWEKLKAHRAEHGC